MPSFSPMVFSPRPSGASNLQPSKAGHQTDWTSADHFSYAVSSDGVEVHHPHVNREIDHVVEDRCSAKEFPFLPGIDEAIGNSTPRETFSPIAEGYIEGLDSCSLNLRRGKPLPQLRIAQGEEAYYSDGSIPSAESQKLLNHSPYLPGTEKYEVIEEIGNDSEGPCTLVRSRSDRQLRVVKSVRWQILSQGRPVEARILQDIFPQQHDNIIRLYACDFLEKIGLVQYHLEYCSRGDLHDLCCQYNVHNAWLPELFIWKVFLEIADALEFLHRGFGGFDQKGSDRPGIVHRDIKPSNIFLRRSQNSTAYPDAVLADFGNASFKFATYEPAGTFRWQPPEIPRKTPKGDVWSLGAVIHEMIHLTPPILALPEDIVPSDANVDRWEMDPNARKAISEIPDQYSQELISVMFMALEMDHNKRASSSRLLSIIKAVMEQQYSPNADKIADPQPLARWAFDHVAIGNMSSGELEHYRDDTGRRQYYEMMTLLWCSDQATITAPIGETY